MYTADQSRRGQAAFAEKCASCHGPDLQGTNGSAVEVDGTPLIGESFLEKWREDDLGEIFRYIKNGMPREAADTVADSVKIDILSFILRSNNFPAGTAELKADSLDQIMLVGKDGPKPLPSATAVRAVGCLVLGQSNVWMLTNAGEPLRTRTPDETNVEEIRNARTTALGMLSFKLPGLDFAIPGVKPADLKGHKVQVKGVVYRQSNNDRINVMTMTSLAETCSP